MVYQMPTYKGDLVQWKADVGWASHDTDIQALVVKPATPAAEKAAPGLRYFPWELLPPKINSLVWVYGWPEPKIKIQGDDHAWDVELRVEPAGVEELIYPIKV